MKPGQTAKNAMPRHVEIASILLDEIRTQQFRKGEKLPSESRLCERFHENRYTIRMALEILIQAGTVEAYRGKGHFVKIQTLMIEYPMSKVMRFSDVIRASGYEPSSQLFAVEKKPANSSAANALGIAPGKMAYQLLILRVADGIPISWNETWLPADRVPELERHLEPFGSLYEIFEKIYNIRLQRVYTTFESMYPTTQMILQLNVTANTSILKIESVTKDQDGQRIEYTTAHYRGDLCRVSIQYEE